MFFDFGKVWKNSGAQNDALVVFQDLNTRYAEPHRHYHNLKHICAVLAEFSAARHFARIPTKSNSRFGFTTRSTIRRRKIMRSGAPISVLTRYCEEARRARSSIALSRLFSRLNILRSPAASTRPSLSTPIYLFSASRHQTLMHTSSTFAKNTHGSTTTHFVKAAPRSCSPSSIVPASSRRSISPNFTNRRRAKI